MCNKSCNNMKEFSAVAAGRGDLMRKEINVPIGFYCNGCIYLGADKNMEVWYCKLSGLWKVSNSEGQILKDSRCLENYIETLKNT